MIKIYGSPKSSAGRVFWLMEEIGLKYERVPLNMREKEHKSDSYLKINIFQTKYHNNQPYNQLSNIKHHNFYNSN